MMYYLCVFNVYIINTYDTLETIAFTVLWMIWVEPNRLENSFLFMGPELIKGVLCLAT